MKFLIDTCVISELVKKNPEPKVVEWIDSISEDKIYLSVVTIGEISRGIEKITSQEKKIRLKKWLDDSLLNRFFQRIVDLDIDTMIYWGKITGKLEKSGKKPASFDSLIGTQALYHNMVLVTRNIKDFKFLEVDMINPWDLKS